MNTSVIDKAVPKPFPKSSKAKKRLHGRQSNWVDVKIHDTDVVLMPKEGHRQLIICFANPKLFREPCTVLHISKPEIVTLSANQGQESLYTVYAPDNRARQAMLIHGHGSGNCTSFVAEASNPSGPIIVR